MAYQIDRYNNTLLTTVEDGTVDQTTDLKFIGKNYAGYGEIQNENFLFLLENFAGANQPSRPLNGQVWFDSSNSKLKFYDGTQWRTTGGAEIGSAEPTGLTDGDFWWDNTNDQLYVDNGAAFILIGPQNAGEGVTQMQSRQVLDDTGNAQSIITATVNDTVVMIISPNLFTLDSITNPITGFTFIQRGITLINSETGETSTTHRFFGTASDADRLEGSSKSEFVLKSGATFDSSVSFPDAGIVIGNSNDLSIFIENGVEAVIANTTGINSKVKFKNTTSDGTLAHVATMTAEGLMPASTNIYDLGSASLQWNDIYATNFVGVASKTTTLADGTGSYRSARVATTPDTVVVRDSNGSVNANLFQGTATQARYADLAEKYSTAEDLAPGTVVCVGRGEAEVEPVSSGCMAIGVVSTDPAVMMNSDAEGQYIGLKGRLPVRVVGSVTKGDAVYVDNNGCAGTAINGGSLVGVALESNSDEGEKLVECVLKV